ncbi:acetyl-CoA C-acyltransferase [Egibacter rhizosphaerae]|uniref:Probable acetyl-CoA acetyltransferase n=1 Tax=Egibacter rhizosphaerae TaxID=1670831 RepID=A0A411YKX6_9ACTN|nr:acetyl-CoA C-acyltransferase [Egibacter rhizosphaerae]
MSDVLVLSGTRTAVGKYGGAFRETPPSELAAAVVREAVRRASVESDAVEHVVFGHVINTETRDMYLARVASVHGGVPIEAPALTVNRLCGSGLQAIVSAAQSITLGDASVAVAGGAECMSRAPYWVPHARWGARMGDGLLVDAMLGGLTDPFDDCHMGITAENVAERWNISREDQDALAVESHQRAARARDDGRFDEQILPIEVRSDKANATVTADEHIRPDTDVDRLGKLPPAFREGGSVTAGNAAGINDGAAALVLANERTAEALGAARPLGRLLGYAHAGVEPNVMGIGPVPAVQRVLDDTGLVANDLDVIELNEAFAAQALAVMRDLKLPPERTNPNGSGISIGHPVGATGAVLTVKALYELERVQGRYALVTMCIGGGQGIAAIFERV